MSDKNLREAVERLVKKWKHPGLLGDPDESPYDDLCDLLAEHPAEPSSDAKGCRHIELPDTLWKRLREAEEKAEEEYRRGFDEGVRRLDLLRREQAAPEPSSDVTEGELVTVMAGGLRRIDAARAILATFHVTRRADQ